MDPLSRTPGCQSYSNRYRPQSNGGNDDFTSMIAKDLSAHPSRSADGVEQRLASGVPPFGVNHQLSAGNSPLTQLALEEMPVLTAPQQRHLDSVKALLDDKASSPNTFVIDGSYSPKQKLDWHQMAKAENFTMRLKGPQAEDALVAAGAALANGTPSLYLVDSRKDLPWFLREADQSYPGLVKVLETANAEEVHLASAMANAAKQTLPSKSDSPKSYDNFLGCMMSGLSEQQYAEGRSHLQAINQTFCEKFGSSSNFCEGINVGSTKSFGNPKDSLMADLDAVRNAKNCVFYAYDDQSRPSGMWVELGAAVAWKKPCTLVIPNRQCLPPCLVDGELPPNLTIVEYQDHEQFLQRLATPDGAAKITGQSRNDP